VVETSIALHSPITYGGESYVPIRIDSIRLDTVPDFALYFRPGPSQPFVLYCERKLLFTRATRKRLEASRVEQLYIKGTERNEYHRYLSGHLEQILRDPKLDLREKSEILYDSAQAVVETVLSQPPSQATIDNGKEIVQQTISFMTSNSFMLEHLLRTISTDYYLYTHSVNVLAYSLALAMHAGHRNMAVLREAANGALLHDIGMSRIDPALANKKGALTNAEWDRLKEHPKLGYQSLRDLGQIGEVALDIVLHHHEKMDGSGYPDGLRGEEISVYIRIITIADVFDALTTDRVHQPRKSTFDALMVMHQEMRNELDMELLRAFVEVMGVRVRF
jgi:HD-GYP domain-containing protein (c-di-GMP phosphodiesterase class II)